MAVPLPESPRRAVADLVQRVRGAESAGTNNGSDDRRGAQEVRWVRMEGLHLTLRFLGPTADERVPEAESVVASVAPHVEPFTVRIATAGAFPSPERPRTLWLAVVQGVPALAELTRRLEDGFAAAGWLRDDRPFKAHLTLARSDGVRSGPQTVRRLVAEASAFETAWVADRIVLFESHTGGGRARYEALLEATLGSLVMG